MDCERCQQPLIEIERYGEQLTGCIDCNCWRGSKSAFIMDLSVGRSPNRYKCTTEHCVEMSCAHMLTRKRMYRFFGILRTIFIAAPMSERCTELVSVNS
jgi:hypothetical protein